MHVGLVVIILLRGGGMFAARHCWDFLVQGIDLAIQAQRILTLIFPFMVSSTFSFLATILDETAMSWKCV